MNILNWDFTRFCPIVLQDGGINLPFYQERLAVRTVSISIRHELEEESYRADSWMPRRSPSGCCWAGPQPELGTGLSLLYWMSQMGGGAHAGKIFQDLRCSIESNIRPLGRNGVGSWVLDTLVHCWRGLGSWEGRPSRVLVPLFMHSGWHIYFQGWQHLAG